MKPPKELQTQSEKSLFQIAVNNLGSHEKAIAFFQEEFSEIELSLISYIWEIQARPMQLPPEGDWMYWFIKSGRRWGKTRAGAEFVRREVESGRAKNICLISETAEDARWVMTEGPSGILSVFPPDTRPRFEPGNKRIIWEPSERIPLGAEAFLFSGEVPNKIRGRGFDLAWADEPAKWKYLKDAWAQMLFASAANLRVVITTTPRRIPFLRKLYKRGEDKDPKVRISYGSMQENMDNLSSAAVEEIVAQYGGTRLGRQEIDGEFLDDNPLAIWQGSLIEKYRVNERPTMDWVVVSADPNASDTDKSDEMGIIVVGMASNGHHYILGDYTMRGSPEKRCQAVLEAFQDHNASEVIYENNKGGDWVGGMLGSALPYTPITGVPAIGDKRGRAVEIGLLHEQGRSHFVGVFAILEDQLCDWEEGNKSPDRMDALVHGEKRLIEKAGVIGGGVIDIAEEFGGMEHDVGRIGLGF